MTERVAQPDWSDEAIAADIRTYEQGVKQRQAFDPAADRGELYDRGNIIVDFLRLLDVSVPLLHESFKALKREAEDKHDPAPVDWNTWKAYQKNLDGRLQEFARADYIPSSPLEGKITEHAKLLASVVFQQKHPNYFPPEFWHWTLPSDAELYGITEFHGRERPSRPARPYWQEYRAVLFSAWVSGFADDYVARVLNVPVARPDPGDVFKERLPVLAMARTLEFRPVFPFQHDILTLVRSTWRAKVCEWCRRPFVADKPMRRFCPERYAYLPEMSCYNQHRRAVKRELWSRKGKQYRKTGQKRRKNTSK